MRLIQPLPYPDVDRLVFISFTPPNKPNIKDGATVGNFLALKDGNTVLDHVGSYDFPSTNERVDRMRPLSSNCRASDSRLDFHGRWEPVLS
jgi:hypothetical protein